MLFSATILLPIIFRNCFQERQLRIQRTCRRSEADLFERWASRFSRTENRQWSRVVIKPKTMTYLIVLVSHASWCGGTQLGKRKKRERPFAHERETRQRPRRKMIRRFKCIYLARRRAGARLWNTRAPFPLGPPIKEDYARTTVRARNFSLGNICLGIPGRPSAVPIRSGRADEGMKLPALHSTHFAIRDLSFNTRIRKTNPQLSLFAIWFRCDIHDIIWHGLRAESLAVIHDM